MTWQPTPVFLPRELHGQRSLGGYSPWHLKELDMSEHLSSRSLNNFDVYNIIIYNHTAKFLISSENWDKLPDICPYCITVIFLSLGTQKIMSLNSPVLRSSRICRNVYGASQVALVVKNPPANAGDVRDMGSNPGSEKSPGGGHGNML